MTVKRALGCVHKATFLLGCIAATAVHAGFSVSYGSLPVAASVAPTLQERQPALERQPLESSAKQQQEGVVSEQKRIYAPAVKAHVSDLQPHAQAPEVIKEPVQAVASVPAPVPEQVNMAPPIESWIVSPADGTLRVVLAKWAAKAGWQLTWEAPVDVPLTVSAEFTGDFRAAVKHLFQSLSASDVNLTGLLYNGNRVLRVTEIGQRAQ